MQFSTSEAPPAFADLAFILCLTAAHHRMSYAMVHFLGRARDDVRLQLCNTTVIDQPRAIQQNVLNIRRSCVTNNNAPS